MTGEMYASDVTAAEYPIHFAIARELGGQVKPFDVYQGPYVVIGADLRAGSDPYAFAPRGLGIVRLWLCSEGDGPLCTIYNESTDKQSEPFWYDDEIGAVEAARNVLAED